MMQIVVNGQQHTVPEGATIAVLLDTLGIRIKHVAVEVNRELVPRENHATYVLHSGDRLEVVTLVGGG